ncbi:MAG TPA: hypothetical protein DE117_06310 [Fervidobacterium sp.]|nr:hypothetical protein [Fervidobacterium sp.]
MKIVMILIGFLFLTYIGTKILPLKLKYANIFFVLSLVTHVLASFSLSYTFLTISIVFIGIFFLVLLYMFGL